MTNQPFLYDPQANVLRQKRDPNRSFGRADYWNTESEEEHEAAYEAHLEYIASLPAYTPVSGWVPEVGKGYVEGKDFIIVRQCDKCNGNNVEFFDAMWNKCYECGENVFYSETKKVAVPIEQKREDPTKEDIINLVDALQSIALYSSADHPESIRES